MAFKISATEVISDTRALSNIVSMTITNTGVDGQTNYQTVNGGTISINNLTSFSYEGGQIYANNQDILINSYRSTGGRLLLAAYGSSDGQGILSMQSRGDVYVEAVNNVKIQGLNFPSSDGSAGQAIVTDGSGNLSFGGAGVSTGKAIAMAIVFG